MSLLSDTQIRNAKAAEKPLRLYDERGLYLEVSPKGGKWWRLKYSFAGKQRLLSLGTYPDTGLKAVREKRDQARRLMAQGVDPSAARKAEKSSQHAVVENGFEAVAREWHATVHAVQVSSGHAARTLIRLEQDIFPWLGGTTISEIKAPQLLQAMRRIEARGAIETAHRALQACGQVFRYAIATGRADRDPTPDLRGALKPVLVKHMAAITDPQRVGELLRFVREVEMDGAPRTIDGLLVQWGDRLFYPGNRRTPAAPGGLRSAGLQDRTARVRARIAATVARRAPQVMVKVTGGGRGMGAIAAHFRYISKGGRLAFEDDRGVVRQGKEALRDLAEQWRRGGTRIPEHSERREAFNIMLSMPAGTDPEIVRRAAREFAQLELSGHRHVMVLHTHQANPHVHLSVRAEGRGGKRLNPRKEDLRRWREVFAEKLRGWGIDAEASSRITRGSRHHHERLGQRKAREQGRGAEPGLGAATRLTPARRQAAVAWCEIAKALASSDDPADRRLGQSVVDFARWLPGVRFRPNEKQPQRELPGLERVPVQKARPEPGWGR